MDKTIRDLYPHLNDEQLAEVEHTWERYLTIVLCISERLESEAKSPADNLTQDSNELRCSLMGYIKPKA